MGLTCGAPLGTDMGTLSTLAGSVGEAPVQLVGDSAGGTVWLGGTVRVAIWEKRQCGWWVTGGPVGRGG